MYRFALAVLGLILASTLLLPPAHALPLVTPPISSDPEEFPALEVVSTSADGLSLEFELKTLSIEPVPSREGEFQSVTIPGGAVEGETGDPGLPVFTRLLAIPDDSGVSVSAHVLGEEDLTGIRVLPIQEDEGDAVAINPLAYERDDFGTAPTVEVGEPVILRSLRVVPLTFRPVRYNPADGTLRVARRVSVDVRFEGRDPRNAFTGRKVPITPTFDKIYRALVANYPPPNQALAIESGTWLAICPNNTAVTTRLQALVDWRRRKGLPVQVVTTATTGTTKESIKSYIQTAYDTWDRPPEYVVLVGDASGSYPIPTWYESLSGYNGEGDHPYTTLAGGDILPDVHIGRLSIGTTNDLDCIVTKMTGYESNPEPSDPGWYTRACLVGDPSQSYLSVIQQQQWIKTRLLQLNYTEIDTIFQGDPPDDDWVTPMQTALNKGDTFFCYRGWYGFSGWGNTYTNLLLNGKKLFFAVISTCGTGSFAGGTSNSEAFVRAGAGAIANPKAAIGAIGTATTGTHTRFNNCMTFGVFQGMLYEGLYEMGAALTRAKLELYINYGQTAAAWAEIFSYWNNLIGDPAGEIWTGFPDTLAVTHPSGIATGTNAVSVTVTEGGLPCPAAQVCLMKGTETHAVGVTDAAGGCELPVTATTTGDMYLTVTKHNRRAYLATIPVTDASVNVASISYEIDDDVSGTSSGNGDGMVNPGESIQLRVELKNFGTTLAPDVNATLGTDEPFVTITESEDEYRDMPGGSTRWGAGDFDFTVAPFAMDGQVFRFDIDITSTAGSWHSILEIPVVAPHFSAAGTTLYGAGANGILDPGETVEFSVALRNDGGQDATALGGRLVSDSPWVTVVDSLGAFPDVDQDSTRENGADRFSISAASYAFVGHVAPLRLLTACNDSTSFDTTLVEVTVGAVSSVDPIGPDRYGYYAFDNTDVAYGDAPTYGWVELDPAYGGSGASLVSLGDYTDYQDASRTVNLPFTFQFYGESFTRATICSNGWIAMGSTYLTDYRNWNIPGAGAPNNLIAVFWDDLFERSGGSVYQKYDAANHRWIVEWSHMTNAVGGGQDTFEAILYDPEFYPTDSQDGLIQFQYQSVNNVDATDGYATVGIQNFDHTDGLCYTYFNQYPSGAAALQSGRAIRFVPLQAAPLATVEGTVYNASFGNAPVSSAQVQIKETGRSFTSASNGHYSGGTPEGTYTLIVTHPSFAPDTTEAVVVTLTQPATVDFHLLDIGGPEIADMTQLLTTTDTEGPYPVDATITDYSAVASATLHYRVNGSAWLDIPMSHVGDVYSGDIGGWPAGTQIDYYVSAEDVIENTGVFPPGAPGAYATFYITGISYSYTVEDPGDAGWSLGVAGDNATTGVWVREEPVGTTYSGQQIQPDFDHTPDPGVKCFVTGNDNPGDPAGDNDVDNGCTTLRSRTFDLSGASKAFVHYWRWYARGGTSADDDFQVDVSNNNGSSWVSLETVSTMQNSWQQVNLDLSPLIALTDQVVFRFVACDEGSPGLVEAAIDDFSLEVFVQNTIDAPEQAVTKHVFRLDGNTPNPFAAGTAIHFTLAAGEKVDLAIYDVQGRLVRRLAGGAMAAGPQVVRWDGRDDRGARAPSGIYFCRLDSRHGSDVRKIIRLE